MNFLLSAYSVNPYKGSEDYIGWNWILQLSKNIKVEDKIYVITKKFNEHDTRKGILENNLKNVELVIVDVPKYLNWFREKYSIFHHMYYILWQMYAYKWIKKSKIKFDVIHHITMNDYRIIGKMWKVDNAYTILGPIGGAQITPKSLKCYEKNRLMSNFRELINKSCSWNPIYRRAIKKFDKIYVINNETKSQIDNINKKNNELLPELAIKESFKNIKITKKNADCVKIIFVGRLINKKGLDLLIDVMSMVKTNHKWSMEIYGDGPEKENIINKISKLNLENKIKLMGKRDFSEISEAYRNGDIFVMPSLRETSGNVVIEAMAYKLAIVGLDTSFLHLLSDKKVGKFINVNQSKEMILRDFSSAIVSLIEDNCAMRAFGENGYTIVNREYTWEEKYSKVYENIPRKKKS